MLRSLAIRDVVLIDQLDVAFPAGLGVLTGETGAGKSILLDALGLALGGRAEARLIRHGAPQASVTAEFDLAPAHAVTAIMAEAGLAGDDGVLLLRRVVATDGRSRAFVNDQPASVALLKRIGEAMVEIHGQFESQSLLDPAFHRGLLDSQGGLGEMRKAVSAAYAAWQATREARAAAETEVETARRDEEFLRHAADEMAVLDPKPGEADELASQRALMMQGEKLLGAMNQAMTELSEGRGVEAALQGALRSLERAAPAAGGRLDEVIAALARALSEAVEGLALLEKASTAVDLDPSHLERIEERLFALRALARKHNVVVDDLATLRRDIETRLVAVADGGAECRRLAGEEEKARAAYEEAADRLTEARKKAAAGLDHAMARELKPLKLEKAVFTTRVEPLPPGQWGGHGKDRVAFEVATNPGAAPGPLAKVASGGELARFMLALKVVLAAADPVPTLVFDEVDSGVGGAVAAAVGERLALLGRTFQVLVVTHSPQVAAMGTHHWRVSKEASGESVRTTVRPLSDEARTEEIARMLAGARVTDEARAAALRLREGSRP